MPKPLVFISHITEEREIAQALKRLVESTFLNMIEVFVSSDPTSITLGRKWLDKVTHALKSCSVEIILASPASVQRPWINFEAGSGWVREIPVIPLCHSGMIPSKLPAPLSALQAATATNEVELKNVFPVLADAIGCTLPDVAYETFIAVVNDYESTNASKPEEISQDSDQSSIGVREATLSVEFASLDRDECIGDQIEWVAEFCEMPSQDEIPDLAPPSPKTVQLPGGGTWELPDLGALVTHERLNPRYFRNLATYIHMQRIVRKIRLAVTNTGETPATDVRLEIRIPHGSGFGFLRWSDIPDAPKRRKGVGNIASMKNFLSAQRHAGEASVEKTKCETKVEIECGNLQPGRKVWTDELYLAVFESGEVQIKGTIFAARLPRPKPFVLKVDAQVQRTTMTVDELLSLDEPEDDED